ncbi:MAG: SDR family oxidoreductase [Planctomycetaceae bacterium]|nr:SDR family oxidoreductase [Planctomycetaceae bacterium]MCA9065944.1 SDR family oxidoreductase [Planctomycetaceae bacterium]
MPTTVQELFDLSGRTVLVTGATGHLGQAMATALAEAGARVIVSSRNLQKGKAAAETLQGAQRGNHFAVTIDYLNEASIDEGFHVAATTAGTIDILVNNGHAPVARDWREITGEEFTAQLGHVTGCFLLARHVRNLAVASSRPANIIMVGSMYGLVGSYPQAYTDICAANPAAYQALKGGIIQLTRHLAVYWASDGVRVNCLSPGPFPGPAAPPALIERLRTHSPVKRMGRPEELKGAVLFLASDASSYVTGHNLVVDGGWTAW